MCFQLGFSSDPIYLLIRAGFNVLECYKVLIYTLMQWDQWNPFKLFDVCQSSITSNAQLFRWTIYKELGAFDYMFTPDIDFDSSTPPKLTSKSLCWPMPYFFDGYGLA